MSVFEDKLDRIDYAYTYEGDHGRELKKFAVDLGKECLMLRVSRGTHSIDPKSAQDSVRSTAFMMAQVAKMNAITSEQSKAALRWAQLCLRAAGDPQEEELGTAEAINLAVSNNDMTTNEKKSGISPAKILHGEEKNENS